MSQWELQSRCRQWHTIAIADRLDPCYLLNLRRRWLAVVVARTGHRSGRQEAGAKHGADDNADSALDTRRQLVHQRFLLHERVASGQQEEVQIEKLQEARDQTAGVDAYADAADHAGRAQLGERPPTAGDELRHHCVPARLGRVVSEVQVMHDGQVNAGKSEPLEAVLVRAQNAVMRVVELDLEWSSAVPRAPIEGSHVGWRPQDAANFGRDDKLVGRLLAQ